MLKTSTHPAVTQLSPSLQAHIVAITHHLNIAYSHKLTGAIAENNSTPLPTHLHRALHTLSDTHKKQFMQYISPLLSPLHALPASISQAYLSAILQHQNSGGHEGGQILMLAVNIVAMQSSAAGIILYLVLHCTPSTPCNSRFSHASYSLYNLTVLFGPFLSTFRAQQLFA